MKDIYSILVVDDEYGLREGVSRVLRPYGHEVFTASDGREAMELIGSEAFDLALIDLKLPDADGLEILDAIQRRDPLTVCIIITAYATLDTAVDATKRGAFDYLAKPFTPEELLIVVDKALDRRDLVLETDKLRRERDRSLLELSLEKSRFKTIISCMSDGVIVTNRVGEVVLYNGHGGIFLDGSTSVKPGTPISECSKFEELVNLVSEAASPEDSNIISGREISTGGRTYLANCAALRDDGEFLGAVTVLRDITEMKEIEKLKSRFVSMVAHELRAPVAAIKGYLDIILTRAAGNDEKVYGDMMARSRERAIGLLDLIKDLLDMSRLDTKRVERNIQPIAINDLLKSNADFLKVDLEKKKLKINLEIPETPVIVKADSGELNRIIVNLLTNAIKYNFENGSITLKTENQGEWAYFSVADTGIGMSEEDKGRLFEEFFRANNPLTRKETGTGLGLSITRKMVESNFGRIKVESEPEKGSKFTVILPAG